MCIRDRFLSAQITNPPYGRNHREGLLSYEHPAKRQGDLKRRRTDYTARQFLLPRRIFKNRSAKRFLSRRLLVKCAVEDTLHLRRDRLGRLRRRQLARLNLPVNLVFDQRFHLGAQLIGRQTEVGEDILCLLYTSYITKLCQKIPKYTHPKNYVFSMI